MWEGSRPRLRRTVPEDWELEEEELEEVLDGSAGSEEFDEEEWEALLAAVASDAQQDAFVNELQARMERVVLSLPKSYSQRAQAEFLKELEDRTKEAFAAAE